MKLKEESEWLFGYSPLGKDCCWACHGACNFLVRCFKEKRMKTISCSTCKGRGVLHD